ncbi:hypothetical protein BC343_28440 [Mucilaginibacter pedocola]|uniref:YD repeat-containing protein n=1 Tax=Mucilaginibacter pedocola TaxID=1792845 RepID=A0A1S9PE72_9SPHI|nr:hypothetical protein BC343_28440 [Mucilaginibacter pedocola]
MKRYLILTFLIFVMIIQSCKKDGSTNNDTKPVYLVSTITTHYEGYPDDVKTFTYDNNNRVKGLTVANSY